MDEPENGREEDEKSGRDKNIIRIRIPPEIHEPDHDQQNRQKVPPDSESQRKDFIEIYSKRPRPAEQAEDRQDRERDQKNRRDGALRIPGQPFLAGLVPVSISIPVFPVFFFVFFLSPAHFA
jgi:hypothetical protein